MIDEGPPGRGRLRTFVRTPDSLPKVWAFVRDQLSRGRQAFIVYPRVEDADPAAGLKAVLSEYQRLETVLAPHRLGLLHGRLSADEKDRVMAAFRAHQIAGARRHLAGRGRGGRAERQRDGDRKRRELRPGAASSTARTHCPLAPPGLLHPGGDGEDRRSARTAGRCSRPRRTAFAIAEADLRLRGPGELLGQAQSGLPPFRFGDLANDLELIRRARTLAAQLLAATASPGPAAGSDPPAREGGGARGLPSHWLPANCDLAR